MTGNPACHRNKGLYPNKSILPANHSYQVVALVLQGGGALGSYQPGVYQGLAEVGLHPNWVAGISIGALNAAIIAGNPPEKRVCQLKAFWETICTPAFWPKSPWMHLDNSQFPDFMVQFMAGWEAWRAIMEGQKGFFVPRIPTLGHQSPDKVSYYDTSALKTTLERFADFDRINDANEMRISVGAVNIRNGDFVYFDNTKQTLRAEHFMASGALPPSFPAVEIDGEYYWDGGIVSNTPLQQILAAEPRKNSLIFQVDLWSARGSLPHDLMAVDVREKDIRFSSRTRMITAAMAADQKYRGLMRELLELVPESEHHHSAYKKASQVACQRVLNIIHLIYQNKEYETNNKDYQFGAATMREHWQSGYSDICQSLAHKEWLAMPSIEKPFVTHDLHRDKK